MSKSDAVNRPSHYTFSAFEVIDVLEAWNLPWHLCNVIKYLARAGRKDPSKLLEDLEKARWYLDRYIALVKCQRGVDLTGLAAREAQ